MSLFHDILSNLQKKFQNNQERNSEIAAIISSIINTQVSEKQLTIKKGTVYLQVPPTIKMTVLLKKEKIITACREKNIPIITLQ